MKTIASFSVLFLAVAFLNIGGCDNSSVGKYATPENARIGTALVCTTVINFAVAPDDRADTSGDLYAVATVIQSLSGGHVPTPAELDSSIQKVAPKNAEEWVTLTMTISAIWADIYPRVSGNPKLALEYLTAISQGLQDSASGFLPH